VLRQEQYPPNAERWATCSAPVQSAEATADKDMILHGGEQRWSPPARSCHSFAAIRGRVVLFQRHLACWPSHTVLIFTHRAEFDAPVNLLACRDAEFPIL
jgi:hypothetical protein